MTIRAHVRPQYIPDEDWFCDRCRSLEREEQNARLKKKGREKEKDPNGRHRARAHARRVRAAHGSRAFVRISSRVRAVPNRRGCAQADGERRLGPPVLHAVDAQRARA